MRLRGGRREPTGQDALKDFLPGAVLEGGARTFSSCAGRQARDRRCGRAVAGVGRGLVGAPPRLGPINCQQRAPTSRRSGLRAGVPAATIMATVREKAAALNLSALPGPAQRPPGRC